MDDRSSLLFSRAQQRPSFVFIYDEYTRSRGEPTMLRICCSNCDTYMMDYQKDGPGRLLRCYLDRIHQASFAIRHINLHCPNVSCNVLIGTPMVYDPKHENRSAYRMIQNRFRSREISAPSPRYTRAIALRAQRYTPY